MSVAKRYANDPLNPAFASSLDDIIENYQPVLWIHGHTHERCDYELFGTRVVCNPRGYPGEKRGSAFDPGFIVEVSG
jgi:Icc-related predicted phosphoesterase